jgi:RNA polymerase sigma-70 factor (ECF subfamily)
MSSTHPQLPPDSGTIKVLLENHRRFLAFLESRVKIPQDAEEILQSAFSKVVERDPAVGDEMAVA